MSHQGVIGLSLGHKVEFRLLGPLEVRDGGQQISLGGPRQRAVLAALLLRANEIADLNYLVATAWERPPVAPEANLRTYVTRLRRVLGAGDRLTTCVGGYRLAVGPGELDIDGFLAEIRHSEQAERQGELATAAEHLGRALRMWRGRLLSGQTLSPALEAEATRLDDLRLRAATRNAYLRIELGEPDAAAGDLRALLVENQHHEELWEQLINALYHAGRQAEAFDAFTTARKTLIEELGVEPGPKLREMHQAILRGMPERPVSPATSRPAPPARDVPAQLPLDVSGFVGRAAELAQLDAAMAEDDATTVVISAVLGTAGVGKTALAVHWAHREANRFPDGQLYVNLRGYDQADSVMHPADALHGFLDALGTPPHQIPTALDARASLYRSLLAGRRVLVVLDNARDANQVRPLLPGSPGCLVVVTSRHQLSGLIAAEGAKPVTLDLLTDTEARQLLAHRLGADRIAAESQAVEQIIVRCARLPLALAVVAARAAIHPHFPLATLADQLRDARNDLDVLADGDAASDVRSVFSWSYRTLSSGAARLFRLLGLHPGPDVTVAAAAGLAGDPPERAHLWLAELTRAHLLTEHTPGRFSCHDLLRAYAAELVREVETVGEQKTATRRLLDYYLHASYVAGLRLQPFRQPIPMPDPNPGVPTEDLPDHRSALAWFTAEYPVLRAVAAHAAGSEYHDHTWRLAWTFSNYCDRRGLWQDQIAAHRAGLEAARRLGDRMGMAHTHRGLGLAYARTGCYDDAEAALLEAVDLFRQQGDAAGQGHTRLDLGWVMERRGKGEDALVHAEHALSSFRTAGERPGQANALNAIGWCHAMRGDYHEALGSCKEALTQFQEIGDEHGEAPTWDSIGYAYHNLGQYTEAIACYERSLKLYQKLGNRYYEADILVHLGDSYVVDAAPDAAHTAWRKAMSILAELDHPDVDKVRDKLHQLELSRHAEHLLAGRVNRRTP